MRSSQKGFSRRDFLKGAAVGTVGAAATAVLGGCTPKPDGETVEAESSQHIPWSWLGTAPVIDESEIVDTVTVDVLVVGGGHAGTQCAKAAAENGASVAVIEKSAADDTGHYFIRGEDCAIYNAQWTIDQGFGPYDEAEVVQEYLKRSAFRANAEILRSYVHNSGEMFDSMVSIVPQDSDILDVAGGQVNVQQAYGNPTYPLEINGYKTWAAAVCFRGGIFLGDTDEELNLGMNETSRIDEFEWIAQDYAKSKGATWYLEHTAVVLAQAENGDVLGCITQDNEGNYHKFLGTKGTVLCTGDFSANGPMCYDLLDEARDFAVEEGTAPEEMASPMGNPGTGHLMGLWAGAKMEEGPRACMSGGGPGGTFGLSPFLYLNGEGKRFMNEGIPSSSIGTCFRTTLPLYTITDSKWELTLQRCGIDHGSPDWAVPYIDKVREQMKEVPSYGAEGMGVRSTCYTEPEASRNITYGASTLDELLGYLGLEGNTKATALESIARYNELCYAGKDEDFCKDANLLIPIDEGPFFGIITTGMPKGTPGLTTLSGLITDESYNCLDAEKNPIVGLYCAGNTLGGRYSVSYSTPSAGNSIGMAMTNGYVVGKYLANL